MLTIFPRVPKLPSSLPHGRGPSSSRALALLAMAILMLSSGCTSFSEWVHNGFKVGPNYKRPPAPVADDWIDSMAPGVNTTTADLACWWNAFNDPVLNSLIQQAYEQNLDLRSAGTRILAARAERNIAAGNLFPQTQQLNADYQHFQTSAKVANPLPKRFFNDNLIAGNLAWELDFWGRFRRAVEAADAELDASVENYDDALVLLISEVATTYVQIRVFQQQIRYADDDIATQTKLVRQTEQRLKGGAGQLIDQAQMRSNLYSTMELREQYLIQLRQANDALCVLLGIPVRDLIKELGEGPIPVPPPEVAVGMPCDLLRRRPDIRRAERLVAAQSARIGIATANLYPRISLLGSIGYEAENFGDLFSSKSFIGSIGPSLQWDVLNYGRLLNGIRVQDALFQTAAVDYQNLVLQAGREVEDGLALFLLSHARTRDLAESEKEAKIAWDEAQTLSKDVKFDINRAFVTSNFLVQERQRLAQAEGDIALGFIQVYKALGGGWEIRLGACGDGNANCAPDGTPAPGLLPAPREAPQAQPQAMAAPSSRSVPAPDVIITREIPTRGAPLTMTAPAPRSVPAPEVIVTREIPPRAAPQTMTSPAPRSASAPEVLVTREIPPRAAPQTVAAPASKSTPIPVTSAASQQSPPAPQLPTQPRPNGDPVREPFLKLDDDPGR
jgi:NodT family efflux transporter outer membrane factor (OMF) lipoprotein